MFITVTKWLSIAALLGSALLRPSVENGFVLQLVVFTGAVMVAGQAVRVQEYLWAFAFGGVALLFNPVYAMPVSNAVLLWLELVCIVSFLTSLVFLKPAPFRAAPSITGPYPRRHAL